MKNNRLFRYNVWISILIILLTFFVLGDFALFLSPLWDASLGKWTGITFFIDSLLAVASSIGLMVVIRQRDVLRLEQDSLRDFFLTDTFIYNVASFKRALRRKLHQRGSLGVVAVVSIKGLNTDVLSLFGSDAVRLVNEITFSSIQGAFGKRKDSLYGFNTVDGFLLYQKTSNYQDFCNQLNSLSETISLKVHENGTLPPLSVLIGTYEIKSEDSIDQMIQGASYASKYNVTTRLASDVMLYSPDLMGENENERDLAHELSRALEEGQLEVVYQPKYDLHTKRFYGAEALIRWNHPTRGVLSPALFIPFAEQSGSIVDIDHYVFRRVCEDIARWSVTHERLLKISVNLSRKTVYDPTILDFFKKTMAEAKVNPLLLDIELTESLAAKDSAFISYVIRKIKAAGMSTSIDDFGVGYSSFSSLKKIPFDTLKIDKAFVDDIEVDKKSRDLVKCVISLAHALDMHAIAEGVQTEKQVEILRKMSLDAIQGYYYARPMSAHDYEKFLHENRFEKRGGLTK